MTFKAPALKDPAKETIVLDQPEQIQAYQLLSQRAAMRLELIGLRHSSGRSVIQHIKGIYGFKGDRRKVFDQFEAHLRKLGVLK